MTLFLLYFLVHCDSYWLYNLTASSCHPDSTAQPSVNWSLTVQQVLRASVFISFQQDQVPFPPVKCGHGPMKSFDKLPVKFVGMGWWFWPGCNLHLLQGCAISFMIIPVEMMFLWDLMPTSWQACCTLITTFSSWPKLTPEKETDRWHLYSLVFEGSPHVAGGIPLPEVPLLPQAFQAPEQIHAALVGHGWVTVSGAGAWWALLRTIQQGPSHGICHA